MKVEIDSAIALDLLIYLANKAKGEMMPKFAKAYIETIENLSKAMLEDVQATNQNSKSKSQSSAQQL